MLQQDILSVRENQRCTESNGRLNFASCLLPPGGDAQLDRLRGTLFQPHELGRGSSAGQESWFRQPGIVDAIKRDNIIFAGTKATEFKATVD